MRSSTICKSFITAIFPYLLSLAGSAQQKEIHFLSGTDKDHTLPWNFKCTRGVQSGVWKTIPVPSNWELQGFGTYTYGQTKGPEDEQGLYSVKFKTPAPAQGKKIFIVFEGVMTDALVRINGVQAGPVHQGGFYQFKFDIGRLLKSSGENLLEVTVSKTSANASVNRAERRGDFWEFGGIFRPVYLEVMPPVFIDRLAIDARADGSFHMNVFPVGSDAGTVVEAQVQTLAGENLGLPMRSTPGNDSVIDLKASFKEPRLWSSEFPNRYKVLVTLHGSKELLYKTTEYFGFRTAALKLHDGFYINGKKILLKGCNRHSFWPETGRTLSHEVHVLDVNLMKEMNMNAVRMSHYPPDADFLSVCDSLGLYVLDELTGWQAAYDDSTGHKLVKELVVRDVNHPSVIMWDNGNEGGFNLNLDHDYKKYDPQHRLVIHPWARFNGSNTKHYPDYAYVANSVARDSDVFFPTEFMHGLYDGGAGAGLDDFWNQILKHPHGAGGFIWAFLDEAVVRTDKNGIYDTDGNHAPDGIVGPHREKEASFYTIKEIWSPVFISPPEFSPAFTGRLDIQNRFDFTNLKACRFNWKLVRFRSAAESSLEPVVLAAGRAPSPDLDPGAAGSLQLALPALWHKANAIYLTALDPSGKEIFTWSWPVQLPDYKKLFKDPLKNRGVTSTTRGDTLIIRSGKVRYYFRLSTGFLMKAGLPGKEVSLSGGPAIADSGFHLVGYSNASTHDRASVIFRYEGKGTFRASWSFIAGQPAMLQYTSSQPRDSVNIRGICFNYPQEKITGMKWLGRGPYRVWKNRLKGQQFGAWHKNYNNAITGEQWNYPEFKGYHAQISWVSIENKEADFIVCSGNPNLYFQMLKPDREKDAPSNNNVDPEFAQGQLGFLTEISPIGTKFQKASLLGPQSQQNAISANPWKCTLWFDFNMK